MSQLFDRAVISFCYSQQKDEEKFDGAVISFFILSKKMSKVIVQHRQKTGPFDCVEQLLDLPKMDQKIVQKVAKVVEEVISNEVWSGLCGAVEVWGGAEEPGRGGKEEEAESDVLKRHHSKARYQIVHRAFSLQVF